MLNELARLASHIPAVETLPADALRALLAAICAFVLAVVIGPLTIRTLRRRQVLDRARKGDSEALDRLSAHKESTPTLGGVILIGAAVVSTCLWARLNERLVLLALGFVVALSLVGFADDVAKLRSGRKGLRARTKMLWQLVLSSGAAGYLYFASWPVHLEAGASAGESSHGLFVPFLESAYLPLGPLFVPLAALVMTGASNAVNLTDGLDGLATGCSVLAAGALAVLALLAGQEATSGFLGIPHVGGAGEVGVFLAAIVGGGLGFLWFNCHPAQIFMGDTGALPLGGALGLVAVVCKQEVLLVLVGGVLVAETASVILQVGAYRIWRRRVFLIAPLHHHFQFKGLAETQITVRFWLAAAVLAVLSLATLGLGAWMA